ncbi:MAG TPA: HAD family hydrolase [Anaerolineaceae bacterium]|nr:HAD family hydrolase [Anaerolineaceae bacterium]
MQTDTPRQALIFDFDGLIVDTESIGVKVFENAFSKVGLSFDLDGFVKLVGLATGGDYDPWTIYANHTGKYSPEEVRQRYSMKVDEAVRKAKPLEGVVELINDAKSKGLLLAVGSSSPKSWVLPKLEHFGILDKFDTIVTCDDVAAGKPSPDIFLKVLERLQVEPQNALVLEDSTNGTIAANRAGIRVVVVPNAITSREDHHRADFILPSLKQLQLADYFQLN